MKGSLLFVYGTMLQKERNHSRLYECQAILLGEAVTIDRFAMHVMARNDAPIAIRDTKGYPVSGEVYAVPDEHIENIIDPMEGHPTYYKRELVWVRWRLKISLPPLGTQISLPLFVAQMYVFQHGPREFDQQVIPNSSGILVYEPQTA